MTDERCEHQDRPGTAGPTEPSPATETGWTRAGSRRTPTSQADRPPRRVWRPGSRGQRRGGRAWKHPRVSRQRRIPSNPGTARFRRGPHAATKRWAHGRRARSGSAFARLGDREPGVLDERRVTSRLRRAKSPHSVHLTLRPRTSGPAGSDLAPRGLDRRFAPLRRSGREPPVRNRGGGPIRTDGPLSLSIVCIATVYLCHHHHCVCNFADTPCWRNIQAYATFVETYRGARGMLRVEKRRTGGRARAWMKSSSGA